METFSVLLALCVENSPVTSEFSSQRPVTRSFDIFFDLRLSAWLSKQSKRQWFETPSHLLLRQWNDVIRIVPVTFEIVVCQNGSHFVQGEIS